MDIFKIVAIGIISSILILLLKQYRPDFAIVASVCASIIMLITIMPYLFSVMTTFEEILQILDINKYYAKIILKVIAIAYVTEFGSALCRDSGNHSISSKIELSGKLIVMLMSMPILYSLIDVIRDIVYWQ